MSNFITINRERVKEVFRTAFYNELAKHNGAMEHYGKNADGSSPIKYWFNPTAGAGNRTGYFICTSGSFNATRNGNDITATVNLNFVKVCRPDN